MTKRLFSEPKTPKPLLQKDKTNKALDISPIYVSLIISLIAIAISVWSTLASNSNTAKVELGIIKTQLYSEYMIQAKNMYRATVEFDACIPNSVGIDALGTKTPTIRTENNDLPCQQEGDKLFNTSLSYDTSISAMLLVAPRSIINLTDDISKSVGFVLKEGELPVINMQEFSKRFNLSSQESKSNFAAAYVRFRVEAQNDINLHNN